MIDSKRGEPRLPAPPPVLTSWGWVTPTRANLLVAYAHSTPLTWYRGLEAFVREQVPLAPLTNYRVGGPAEFFAEPPDEKALTEVLRRAAEEALPVRVLGHGTNLLVGDDGVSGLVLRLPKQGFGQLEHAGPRVRAGAGHSLPALVKWSVSQGLGGLECLVGVPGTLGAALRMNAGGKYGEVGALVRSVRGCALDGTPFEWGPAACGFTYRDSALHGRIVTNCELELQAGPGAPGPALVRKVLDEKRASQPLAERSAGCVFKNPRLPGVPAAGRIIDELGLKGMRVGGASVSPMHANFLVCGRAAKAADVAELIRRITNRVWAERGVRLELEIEVWGLEVAALLSEGGVCAA